MAKRYSAGPTEHMRRSRSGILFFLITAILAVVLACVFAVSFFIASANKSRAEQTCREAEAAKENAKQIQETATEEYNAAEAEIEALKERIAELS